MTAASDDPMHENDTNTAKVFSKYTPGIPDTIEKRQVSYATCDTVSYEAPEGMVPIWYDYNNNLVDTGSVHVTEMLYGSGSMGVGYISAANISGQIGDSSASNTASSFPSPFQSMFAYVKQQYI